MKTPLQKTKTTNRWLSLGRIVPTITIVVAALVLVSVLLGWVKTTVFEGVVLAILTLLAVDALTERMSVIENLERKIDNLATSKATLRDRSTLPIFWETGNSASEVFAIGVSLISAVVNHQSMLEQKVKEGHKVRLLLLNPVSPTIAIWDASNKPAVTRNDIERTLQILEKMKSLEKHNKRNCQIRISDIFLPFSVVVFDADENEGRMIVEYHTYNRALMERPHIQLTRAEDGRWYDFYLQQCEQFWKDAKEWQPNSIQE